MLITLDEKERAKKFNLEYDQLLLALKNTLK